MFRFGTIGRALLNLLVANAKWFGFRDKVTLALLAEKLKLTQMTVDKLQQALLDIGHFFGLVFFQ